MQDPRLTGLVAIRSSSSAVSKNKMKCSAVFLDSSGMESVLASVKASTVQKCLKVTLNMKRLNFS